MIIDLPSTTASAVNKALVDLRERGGAVALGRVLTLLVVTDEEHAETAIENANHASREHPCRIIVTVEGSKRGTARLDAQVRVGGDAGASEVVVLRPYGPLVAHSESVVVPLLLPDAPIVAWWPGAPPECPAMEPMGRLAQRRVVDAAQAARPSQALVVRSKTYTPGDTDLAWTRLTLWRGVLAAAFDEAPGGPILGAIVTGGSDSPSADLMCAWLALKLRCPVKLARGRAGEGLVSVRLERRNGYLDLVRPDEEVASLAQPGQPPRRVSLPKRPDRDCLAEELRRLDPDEVFGEVVTKGLFKIARKPRRTTAKAAVARGEAPSPEAAKKAVRKRTAGPGTRPRRRLGTSS